MLAPELSGLVLTHNERDPSAIISQLSKICGQVVVVQDIRYGSFDSSFVAGANSGCEVTVLERDFDSFPGQRNAGIEQAIGKWVLSVDSDELLSPALSDEIAVLEPPQDVSIYAMPKRERVGNKTLKLANPSGLINPLHPRLFRSSLRYAPQPLVHERFVNEDEYVIVPLSGHIEHFPEEGILGLWLKALHYGRVRGSVASKQPAQGNPGLGSNLARFVMEDGIVGAAVAGMKIAYGVGTKTARRNRL